MRIGIVTGEYPPMQGGVGAYSAILAEAFYESGHRIAIFSRSETSSSNPAITITTTPNWHPRSLHAIRRWIQAEQLDLVNLQFQTAAFDMSPWIHFLPNVLPVPTITTFHDLRFPYLFPKAGPLRDWIVRHLAHASRGAIATNPEDDVRLSKWVTCEMIPIGSNIRAPQPASETIEKQRIDWGVSSNQYVVGYFGLMNHSKGLDILLASMRNILDSGISARLQIIGGGLGSSDPSNAEFMREFTTQIHSLGLESAIQATGYLEDDDAVARGLSACDVLALPFADGASFRRGSLMAALQYGCPVITTEPGMAIPAFVDGENMRLIPRNDSAALTTALRELWKRPDLRSKLSAGARLLSTDFNWNHIAAAQLTFFEQILKAVTK